MESGIGLENLIPGNRAFSLQEFILQKVPIIERILYRQPAEWKMLDKMLKYEALVANEKDYVEEVATTEPI